MKITEDLLIRFLECSTTSEEESAILDWLEADPSSQKQLDALDFEFSAAVLNITEETRQRASGKRNPVWKIMAYAAAAVVAALLVVGNGWHQSYKTRSELEKLTTTINVPVGQRINLTLQDGTHVWLNAGSSLEYPNVFGKDSRTVKLTGEAMMDVQKDAERPFRIVTFAGEVEVLGTRFDVIADSATSVFSTAVLDGSVRLTSKDRSASVTLAPGEKAEFVEGRFLKTNITTPDEYLWTEGIINLQSDSFLTLLAKLERAYDVRFIIQRETTPAVHCRGKIRISDGIEHALEILKLGTDFKYEIRRGSNEIYIR